MDVIKIAQVISLQLLNQVVTVICNPYYSSFYTSQRKDAETVAHLLSELKAYQVQPSEPEKERLSKAFDKLFSRTTGYLELVHRIELTLHKKAQLLAVLDYPKTPLHNNLAEQAVREYVVKLKISNGTRTQDGTKSWDVYLSVLGTCRKLGVNFYRYVLERISGSFSTPSLAELIGRQSQPAPT